MSVYIGQNTAGGSPTVKVDGKKLPGRLDLREHSPDGFAWGYSGSGPAQLALAILAHHFRQTQSDVTLVPLADRERWGRDANVTVRAGKRYEKGSTDLADKRDADSAALSLYQAFKGAIVARWDMQSDWRLTSEEITRWIESRHSPLVNTAMQAHNTMTAEEKR